MISAMVTLTHATSSAGANDRANWRPDAHPWTSVMTPPTARLVTDALANTAAASIASVATPTSCGRT